MKKLLIIALLFVGCASNPKTNSSEDGWYSAPSVGSIQQRLGEAQINSKKPATLTFEIGMTLEEFKTKNENVNGLEIVYADENNIVYKKVKTSESDGGWTSSGKYQRTLSQLPVPFLYFKNGILIKQIVQPSNTTLDFN